MGEEEAKKEKKKKENARRKIPEKGQLEKSCSHD